MKRSLNLAILLTAATFVAFSATAQPARHEIAFPDILGYQTLLVDFHTHTVFSDGLVWPTVRVDEAWREGLDAVCITDHIEYKPHKDDVNIDDNRPFEIAAPAAEIAGILLFKGVEITRDTPPGHYNAVFLQDAAPLKTDEFLDAIEAANKQDAFVFWNHPLWKGLELGDWREIQDTMYEKGWLHGIEVANGGHYYPEAHQLCLDKDLAMIGNSDIHAPSLIRESTHDEHRTATLVLVEERTTPAIKEAARAGRTIAWAEHRLVGKPEYLTALFNAMVTVQKPHHRSSNGDIYTQIHNSGNIDIELTRTGEIGPQTITLKASATHLLKVNAGEDARERLVLPYRADNLLAAPNEGLHVELILEAE